MILVKTSACCLTYSAEYDGSDCDMGTSNQILLCTSQGFPTAACALQETSERRPMIAGEQTSSARCRLEATFQQ